MNRCLLRRRNVSRRTAAATRAQKQGTEFLLSGLLICQRCHSAYCGRRSPRTAGREPYVYYRCLGTDKYRQGGEAICDNASLNGSPLEEMVWADLCDLLRHPQRLQRELERRMAILGLARTFASAR